MNKCTDLEFLATIIIPQGFILPYNDELKTSISFDESSLVLNKTVEKCYCDPEGICSAIKNSALLTGLLYYNVAIGDFRPAMPIDSIISATSTQFSSNGVLQVHQVIDSSYNDYDVVTHYSIQYNRGVESVTCPHGRSIYRANNNCQFMKLLNNPSQTKILSIPYRIKFLPGCKKDDYDGACNYINSYTN